MGGELLPRLEVFCSGRGGWRRKEAACDYLGMENASEQSTPSALLVEPWAGTCGKKTQQIPQDRSPLHWQLVRTWGLTFCIFDGDVEVHQQLSVVQSTASEEERLEEGKAHMKLGREKRKRFCSWTC